MVTKTGLIVSCILFLALDALVMFFCYRVIVKYLV